MSNRASRTNAPAEQAGIKLNLNGNKWLDLIKKASQKEKEQNA